jgi:hypothetical protein
MSGKRAAIIAAMALATTMAQKEAPAYREPPRQKMPDPFAKELGWDRNAKRLAMTLPFAELSFTPVSDLDTGAGFVRFYKGGEYRALRKKMRKLGFRMLSRHGNELIYANGGEYVVFKDLLTYHFTDLDFALPLFKPQPAPPPPPAPVNYRRRLLAVLGLLCGFVLLFWGTVLVIHLLGKH